jgi:hypothetical protein
MRRPAAPASAVGLDAKAVRVISPFVGGGFGGKSADRQAVEAARLAHTVKGPRGRGFGIACSVDAGSYDVLMAEVRVDAATGTVRVERVVCARDMGIVVSPEGAKMQMEGSIVMGLGYTFSEELRFRGGDILDRNFKTYRIPRFSWVPRIETVASRRDARRPDSLSGSAPRRGSRAPRTPTRIATAARIGFLTSAGLRWRGSLILAVSNARIANSLPTEGREEVRDARARSGRAAARSARATKTGGAERDRTVDLLNAIQALSQTELQPHARRGREE